MTAIERVLSRDRWVLAACLLAVIAVSWVYLLAMAGMGMGMPDSVMAPMPWSVKTALLMFAMWLIMMIAMMVPSAAPTVLLYATIDRKQSEQGRPSVGAGVFLAGYLAVWAAFSVIATGLQWALESSSVLAPDMRLSSRALGGAVVIAAGLYQLTPVKAVCLRHCQSPILFLSTHWRPGAAGAFGMGLRHGAYCLGCCWALMALLFVAGVMNLLWIAGLTVYVGLEKLVAGGPWFSRAVGALLVPAGLVMLVGAA